MVKIFYSILILLFSTSSSVVAGSIHHINNSKAKYKPVLTESKRVKYGYKTQQETIPKLGEQELKYSYFAKCKYEPVLTDEQKVQFGYSSQERDIQSPVNTEESQYYNNLNN